MTCVVCRKKPAVYPRGDDPYFCSRKCIFDYSLTQEEVEYGFCDLHNLWYFTPVNSDAVMRCRLCENEGVVGYLDGEVGN